MRSKLIVISSPTIPFLSALTNRLHVTVAFRVLSFVVKPLVPQPVKTLLNFTISTEQ
uniref:Uncharacterized protein n=1 Tax=Anguilla anguilla TaxID=7936 RepID=A0A0E9TSL6_ANGAN